MSNSPASIAVWFINEFFWPDVCASSAVLTDHLPRIQRLRPHWRLTVLTGDRAWDHPDVRWPVRERWNSIDILRVPRPAVRRSLWGRGRGFAAFHRGVSRAAAGLSRPDAIVGSTAPPLGGRLGARLARGVGCPHIYKVLDLYPDCAEALGVIGTGGISAWGWRRIDTHAMRRSAAVVAISSGIARRIERTRGIGGRLRTIFDGYDPLRVRFVPRERNSFAREAGVADRFIVQYAGNMGRSHPLDAILDAAHLLAGDPRFLFQFIGVGPGRDLVEAAIRAAAPRSERPAIEVRDYEPAERVAEVLSAADVALISQAEGMAELSLPYKFYGILAAARPFVYVGPEESEIVALCRERGCGSWVRTGDGAGLANELRRLADDGDARDRMGRAGRTLLEERFSSELAAQEWVDLIELVTTESTTRRDNE